MTSIMEGLFVYDVDAINIYAHIFKHLSYVALFQYYK